MQYPKATPLGKRVVTPQDLENSKTVQLKTIEQALGQALGVKVVKQALEVYGYEVSAENGTVKATLPPYRQDLMHAMDIVEDVAIAPARVLEVTSGQFRAVLDEVPALAHKLMAAMAGRVRNLDNSLLG